MNVPLIMEVVIIHVLMKLVLTIVIVMMDLNLMKIYMVVQVSMICMYIMEKTSLARETPTFLKSPNISYGYFELTV